MSKKVKFYGLFNVTKPQYSVAQGIALLVLALFWIWALFGNLNEYFFGFAVPAVAVVTVAEIVETVITFRQFGKK